MFNRINAHRQAFSLAVTDWHHHRLPYIGVPHNGNVGDEELFRIAQRYLGVEQFATEPQKRGRYVWLTLKGVSNHFVIGGGSLIFSRQLLGQCERLIHLGGRPILIGTGCTDFPDSQADQKRWATVLHHAELRGVRGKYSQQCFARLGLQANIVGDFGYLVNLDLATAPAPADYVVINIRNIRSHNKPELGHRDAQIRQLFQPVMAYLAAHNIPVVVASAYISADHQTAREWAAQFDTPLRLVLYDGTYEPFADVLQNARAVITMRMHPGIFAAAYGTPTIMLDNRSKYFDSISPVPNVITLLDPETVTEAQLLQQLEEMLAEPFVNRQHRFQTVQQLAQTQADYCLQIKSHL